MRRLLLPLLLLGAVPGGRAADPTPEQQYWLELMNRMRDDPATELERLVNFSAPGVWDSPRSDDPDVAAALNFFGVSAATLAAQWSTLTAAPPLAWNGALNVSATTYSDVMVGLDQQAHGLDGLTLAQRVTNGGYTGQLLELGESLFASTENVFHGHAAFAIDWGPGTGGIQTPPLHREVLMDGIFKEVGVGYQSIPIPGGNTEAVGPEVVTHHYATQYRQSGLDFYSDAILTGVVYADTIAADLFYTPGEGWAGADILVYVDATDLLVASGLTNSAGGYNLTLTGLTDGILYRVEAPDTGLAGQTFTLDAHVENYGVPVTFYDNVYASFQAVPEPGGALLLLLALLSLGAVRRR